MISRLGDEHSTYLTPKEAPKEDQTAPGRSRLRRHRRPQPAVPEKRSLSVLLVYPGSPAEQAGIKMHDSILAVDGQPVISDDGARQNLLRGPEGVRSRSPCRPLASSHGRYPSPASGSARTCRSLLGADYPAGKRIGYIFMTSFTDTTMDESIAAGAEADVGLRRRWTG